MAFEEIVDEIDLKCGEDCADIPEETEPHKDSDREQALKEVCMEHPQYDNLKKLWA